MKWRDRLDAIDRLQKSRGFKLIASAAVVLIGVLSLVTYVVAFQVEAPRVELSAPELPSATPQGPAPAPVPEAAGRVEGAEVTPGIATQEQTDLKETVRAVNAILARRADPTMVATAIAALSGLYVLAIWLGLGLTYLGLSVALAGVFAIGRAVPAIADLCTFAVGAISLWAIFIALMEGSRLLFSGAGPVWSIARNTLDEARRIRISGVFVVLLIFLLAALPLLLSENQPLRYRVQQFLQYGTGISYMVIAVLAVIFSVASVALEQRGKVIWQTMTKPVAAWQYVLGKWLGVATLSAVLLAVTGGAVFLFTEYLRSQKAQGEVEAFLSANEQEPVTPDRQILETQILAARVTRSFSPPQLDEKLFAESVDARIRAEQALRPEYGRTPAEREEIASELKRAMMITYRSVDPGGDRYLVFDGLSEPKRMNQPVVLRFKPESGSNRPDTLYTLTFLFDSGAVAVRRVALAQFHSMTLSPSVINADGRLGVTLVNGDFFNRVPNAQGLYFAEGSIELSYSAGSYRTNFARVFLVLWLKIAFVSMAGIFAATFLSFPVATLTAFGIFLVSESSGFVRSSLENWNVTDGMGNDVPLYIAIDYIASGISYPMQFYAELRPTQKLVDGLLLPWSSIATSGVLLVVLVGVLFGLATVIFRSRELAIYSGN
mgnify:CR=1 FL=1